MSQRHNPKIRSTRGENSSGPAGKKLDLKPLKKRLRIHNRQGLHARPAALFVRVANRFKSDVRVRKGRQEVDGKSIMGVLTLAAERGATIVVTVQGPDAKEALHALELLMAHHEMPAVVTVVKHRSSHGA